MAAAIASSMPGPASAAVGATTEKIETPTAVPRPMETMSSRPTAFFSVVASGFFMTGHYLIAGAAYTGLAGKRFSPGRAGVFGEAVREFFKTKR